MDGRNVVLLTELIPSVAAIAKSIPGTAGNKAVEAQEAAESARDEAVAAAETAAAHSIAIELTANQDGTYTMGVIPATGD